MMIRRFPYNLRLKLPGRGLLLAALLLCMVGSAAWGNAAAATKSQGDLNGDSLVTTADLDLLIAHYPSASLAQDVNGDSVVNLYDLSILLGNLEGNAPNPPPATSPEFYGINGQRLWASGVNSTAVISDMAAAGIKYVRVNADWRFYEYLEPVNGIHQYRFSPLDAKVGDLARAGIRFQPMIAHAPDWAQKYPNPNSPPSDDHMADWLAYCQALNARYGQNGSFWSANPTLPKLPIQVYEIWNEQNAGNGSNWSVSMSNTEWKANTTAPAEYASLFRQTYATLKAADPSVKVIVGALTGGPSSMGNDVWMQRMMAADPTLPMDGIGLHPYAAQLSQVYDLISSFRTGLNALPALPGGNASAAQLAPLYITEVGWSAQTPDNTTWTNQTLTAPAPQEATRAAYLKDLAVNLPGSTFNIVQLAPHTAVTDEDSTTDREKWMGIWNRDGSRKPSAQGYADGITAHGP